MNHIKHIDALRFIAVCLVLCHHWILIQPLKYLPFGSTISFVISSFLIGRILLNMRNINNNATTSIKPLILFYIRRAIRIFPAYYVLIVICWILDYGKKREVFLYLITFTTNFHIVNFGNTLEFLGHLWSVAVQEQYYIVIPIILLLIPIRYIKFVSFISIGVGLFYRFYVYYYDLSFWHLHVSTLSCLDTFGVGTYIAYLSIYEKETFKKLIENKSLLRVSIIILFFAAVFGTFFQKGIFFI